MSIRDAEKNRIRQERQIAEKKLQEAEARPDVMHRALVFLLKEQAKNNRDTTGETRYYINALDSQLANPEKLAELEAPPVPAVIPPATQEAEEDNPASAQPNTAEALRGAPPRQSRRFSGRT